MVDTQIGLAGLVPLLENEIAELKLENKKLIDLLDRLFMAADDEIYEEVFDTLASTKKGWDPREHRKNKVT